MACCKRIVVGQPVFFMVSISRLEEGFQQEGHITCISMSSSDLIIDHGTDLSGRGALNSIIAANYLGSG